MEINSYAPEHPRSNPEVGDITKRVQRFTMHTYAVGEQKKLARLSMLLSVLDIDVAIQRLSATPPLAPCEPSAEMGALQARRDELVASFAGANEPTKIMLTVRLDELDRCLRAREAPSVCDHAQTNLVKDSGHGVTRPFSFYLCMACGKQLTERENAARALFVKEKLT